MLCRLLLEEFLIVTVHNRVIYNAVVELAQLEYPENVMYSS